MVLRIDHIAPEMHGHADQPKYAAPGLLLRSVFVALIVATTFAVAGMLQTRSNGAEEAAFDPRCELLKGVEATSCNVDFLAQ